MLRRFNFKATITCLFVLIFLSGCLQTPQSSTTASNDNLVGTQASQIPFDQLAPERSSSLTSTKPLIAVGLIQNKIGENGDFALYTFSIAAVKFNETHYLSTAQLLHSGKNVVLALPKQADIGYISGGQAIDADSVFYETKVTGSKEMAIDGAEYYAENARQFVLIASSYLGTTFYLPRFEYNTTQTPWQKIPGLQPIARAMWTPAPINKSDVSETINRYGLTLLADEQPVTLSWDKKPPTVSVTAKGTVKVAVPIFYKGNKEPNVVKLIKGTPSVNSFPAEARLNYADQWLETESQKLLGEKAIDLQITFFGPYKLDSFDENKLTEIDEVYVNDTLVKFFKQNSSQSGEFDIIAPTYIGHSGFSEFASREGKFVVLGYDEIRDECAACLEQNTVQECDELNVEFESGNIGYACSSLETEFVYRTRVFIHEIFHVFGANDKYNVFACGLETRTPKETTDIMCGALLLEDPSAGEKSWMRAPSLSQVVITDLTAKEIGWKDADGDGVPEINDDCPLDPDNNC